MHIRRFLRGYSRSSVMLVVSQCVRRINLVVMIRRRGFALSLWISVRNRHLVCMIFLTYAEHMLNILGLGDYLASLDPRQTRQEHLQRVLIFCETHIKRAFKKKFGTHDATPLIDLIPRADELSKVLRYMDQATGVWPETANWFKNKRTPWILAGLTREASKIPIYWWMAAPNHTRFYESSHSWQQF